jgi:hypothetical protein
VKTAVGLVALLASLAAASSAAAETTIGQLAPGTPSADCNISPSDALQPTVTSGNSYVVPAGGVAITSWSTNAAAGSGQMLEMKVFRKVGGGTTYQVVGHDGPRLLTGGTINTFPVNVPVQAGDVLGFNDVDAATVNSACIFAVPGESNIRRDGNLGDGQSGDFSQSDMGYRNNISAVVGFKPSNKFSFGAVKKRKGKGTAALAVEVPGPGTLSLSGKGIKSLRLGTGASASLTVTKAGTVSLSIKPRGKAKRKLNVRGKVKVKAKVTYTPNGTASGDVVGDPKTLTQRIKLIKR